MTREQLIRLVAVTRMRPATEADNPYFFGAGVWYGDVGDEAIMFGEDDDGTLTVLHMRGDGFTQMDLVTGDIIEEAW